MSTETLVLTLKCLQGKTSASPFPLDGNNRKKNKYSNLVLTCNMSNALKIVLQSVLLILAGLLVILICRAMQYTNPPKAGEYYYSSILMDNYTILCACVFFIIGLLIGYCFRLNPWHVGLSLILIFPIVTFYEATIYRRSHNLLPFELVIYFLYSLPAVVGVYLGKFIQRRKAMH